MAMNMLEKLLLPEVRELIHNNELETLKELLNRWEPSDIADWLSDLGSYEDGVSSVAEECPKRGQKTRGRARISPAEMETVMGGKVSTSRGAIGGSFPSTFTVLSQTLQLASCGSVSLARVLAGGRVCLL